MASIIVFLGVLSTGVLLEVLLLLFVLLLLLGLLVVLLFVLLLPLLLGLLLDSFSLFSFSVGGKVVSLLDVLSSKSFVLFSSTPLFSSR